MTPEQKALVRNSFTLVLPIADDAAALFYARLFELDPALRSLFHADLRDQGRKLMQTLNVAVNSLDNLDRLGPALHALGRRHVDYGVAPDDFATVGAALLWTLERGLGSAFTPDVRDAWATAYHALVEVMLEGMRQSAEPVAA